MSRPEIKITKEIANECFYKMEILESEPDLLESYELEESEVDVMRAAINKERTRISQDRLTEKQREAIAGELDNAADIQSDNLMLMDKKEADSTRRYIRALRLVVKQLRA